MAVASCSPEGRLDRLLAPRFRIGGRLFNVYKLFGYVGIGLGTSLALALAAERQIFLWVTAAMIGLGYGISYLLTLAVKAVTGEERLVFLHYLITGGAATALALRLAERPVVPQLEALILGLGLMQACGRLGCLAAGCCHGRPHSWGVRYGESHRRTGFPAHLVGVRLFPVQLVEAAWSLLVVAVAAALVARGVPPGTGLAAYLIGYPGGRFALEFLRGDADRPFRLGFSEAQWTSVGLVAATVLAGAADLLPVSGSLSVAGGAVLATAVVRAIHSRLGRSESVRLSAPRHVGEIAGILDRPARPASPLGRAEVRVECTSLGLQVSAGTIPSDGGWIRQYTLSRRGGPLSIAGAATLSRLLLRLRHPRAKGRLLRDRRSIFHLLVEAGPGHCSGQMDGCTKCHTTRSGSPQKVTGPVPVPSATIGGREASADGGVGAAGP